MNILGVFLITIALLGIYAAVEQTFKYIKEGDRGIYREKQPWIKPRFHGNPIKNDYSKKNNKTS